MAAPGPTRTDRGRRRHEQLLDATAELVAARGFHAVGIVDIGAAAGVTGSAIYRHFRNKQEMLVALIERVVDELLSGARAAVDGAADAPTALDALVRAHVAFASATGRSSRCTRRSATSSPTTTGAGCDASSTSTRRSGATWSRN